MTSPSSDAGYLLDTNVVSETRRRIPDATVMLFLDALDSRQMYVSVLTLGELRKGAEARRRADPAAAERLSAWVETMETDFRDRVLPINSAIADLWGRLSARRPRPIVDTLIAATAAVRGLTLVTRNIRDVADTGVPFINPWPGG